MSAWPQSPASPPGTRHVRSPLGRRLVLINLALLAALLTLGGALAWSVYDMRRAVTGAADEYNELQLVEQAMFHCALAKSQLADPDGGSADAAADLQSALDALQAFRAFQHEEDEASEQHQDREWHSAEEADKAIAAVLAAVIPMQSGGVDLEHIAGIDLALHHLSELAANTDIAGAKSATSERMVTALVIIAALAALVVLGSILAATVCYWAVMNPLKRLHSGVRRVASGEFGERLEEEGSREFAELAADFNRMASELATLYTDLETKVQTKSQELVRSERLASVGFLAAGVAHEINNPLNIMSGYAEMARGWLDRAQVNGHVIEVQDALEVIRQEAFRCKDITNKLLSLATTGDTERHRVILPRLINDVVQLLRGLKKYRDYIVTVACEESASQPVHAHAAEIKQVLLNLMVNALDAARVPGGQVRVACHARGRHIELSVSDNGVGMSPEVLERVFEPFFSTSRSRVATGQRGIGLGLSISHAIIIAHGGTITAHSAGPGRGSCFVIELPIVVDAAQEVLAHDH